MSTNSNIAIKLESGKIRSVYCHWDGYIQHNGKILNTYYNSVDKVIELINNGTISILAPNIGNKHDFDLNQCEVSFEDRVCTFYHRDRNKSWENNKPNEYNNEYNWLADAAQEYNYLFKDNEWFLVYRNTKNEIVYESLNEYFKELSS